MPGGRWDHSNRQGVWGKSWLWNEWIPFIEFKISVGVLQGGVFYMVKYISKQN